MQPVTAGQLVRWFWQAPDRRSQAERAYLKSLAETDAHSARVWRLAEAFVQMVRLLRATTPDRSALAVAIGKPGAVRAVGRATGLNRVAILIPCHRVV